jgi:transcriptional regulator with XRE-family HTH domain
MPATPKRAGRSARAGSRFPSEILGHNVRAYRDLGRLTQDDLAERMSALRFEWARATVSEVERAGRSVTADELFALAGCLQTTIAELLDPAGPLGKLSYPVDIGAPENTWPSDWARGWVYGARPHAILLWGASGENKNRVIGALPTDEDLSTEQRQEVARQWFGKEPA